MNEDRYYGSDLNKFIDNNCRHDFTSINIDLFQLRWSKKCLRIIESKHTIEKNMKKGQYQALKFLAQIFNIIKLGEWKFEVYIIYGDEPYNELRIINLTKNKEFKIIGKDNVIKWLEMELII